MTGQMQGYPFRAAVTTGAPGLLLGGGYSLCLDLVMAVLLQSVNTHWACGACQSHGCPVMS